MSLWVAVKKTEDDNGCACVVAAGKGICAGQLLNAGNLHCASQGSTKVSGEATSCFSVQIQNVTF